MNLSLIVEKIFSMPFVAGSHTTFSNEPTFSLVFFLLPLSLEKPFSLLFTSLTSFNCQLSSGFPIFIPTHRGNVSILILGSPSLFPPSVHSHFASEFRQELTVQTYWPPATSAQHLLPWQGPSCPCLHLHHILPFCTPVSTFSLDSAPHTPNSFPLYSPSTPISFYASSRKHTISSMFYLGTFTYTAYWMTFLNLPKNNHHYNQVSPCQDCNKCFKGKKEGREKASTEDKSKC